MGKTIKKLLALAITFVMVMSLSIVAFAAGEETPTKTITLENGKAGHTYTLYQVFTGKVVEGTDDLTDIQWGTDAPDSLKTEFPTAAAAARDASETDDARAWAQELTFTGGTSQKLEQDGSVVFGGLAEGYYVVLDSNGNQDAVEGDFSSAVIVQLVKDVTMALKGSAPSAEKKVADNNDSERIQPSLSEVKDDEWQDSADYDIGDYVPFELKATTADNVASYKKYHITFQDKQSAGLEMPEGYSVSVLGQTISLGESGSGSASTESTNITAEVITPEDGQTFAIKVTFEPIGTTYLDSSCNSTPILVKYTAKLNEDAVIGKPGNPNESYIKYSNNPESTDDHEEGKTPEDKVIVFTYKTDIDKIDETGAELKGADFTLYKEVPAGTEGATQGSAISFTNGVNHDAIKANSYYVVVGHKTGDAQGATFEFNGIDDGTYVLVETTVPAGYNAWASSEVTVAATHTDGDAPELKELTASGTFKANLDDGSITKENGSSKATVSGELYAEIINNSGSTLPSTGGMGTTIFYVIGGILVLAAAIVLISKRRVQQ